MTSKERIRFVKNLHLLDRADFRVRDMVILFAIIHNPGISITGIRERVGYEFNTYIYRPVRRLMKRGLIEDRRPVVAKSRECDFHATEKGIAFFDSLFDD